VAAKDLFSVDGDRATFCAHPDFHRKGRRNAPALAALDRAGAIDLGGLHMAEFAMGAAGWNETQGFLSNPFDGERVSGGSSSGSAAAVARRLVHAALGTDTGGSIRVPSSFCGVVGFKPSNGLVSTRGVFPVSPTLDTVGVVTRTVADCACVMDALTGGGRRFLEAMDGEAERRRIGILDPRSLPTPPEREALAAVEIVRRAAERAGHEVLDIKSDLPGQANVPSGIVFLSEAGAVHLENLRAGMERIGAQVRNRLLLGLTYPAGMYIRAMGRRDWFLRRWRDEVLSRVDVVICPSTPCPAPRKDAYAGLDADGAIAFNGRLGSYTAWANYLGAPALSLPAPGAGKLPIGVQVIGGAGDDAMVLRIAGSLEQQWGPVEK
jgi:aspartyl-tRNA(Asn)/glutamyl-tRNA(Gln) amidotransferase subunit A